ncbi:hypothetical protein GBAR_LOCUS20623, partial [Geodia barretti]
MNVPPKVVRGYKQLAGAHGVFFQATDTGFTVQGHIDSVYNLRAEVDARLLQWKPPQPTVSSSPQPVGAACDAGGSTTPSGAPVAPPPGMPTHLLPRAFSCPSPVGHNPPAATASGSRFDPTAPLRPSALVAHEPIPSTTVGHVPPGPLPYTSYEPIPPASTGPLGPLPTSHMPGPPATAGYPASAVPTSHEPSGPTTVGHVPPGPLLYPSHEPSAPTTTGP